MKSSAAKIQVTSFEELFGPSAPEPASGPFQEISLTELHPFKDHPFHVTDDEKMQELVESVAQHGVLVPGIVRPRSEGGYELVAGHRRKRASELAGKDTMPVIVCELNDDEAVLFMVDSTLQREKIFPSEKAFAYKMKLEAMKRQGKRTDLTSNPVGGKFSGIESAKIIGGNSGDSQTQVRRYIRLTYLVPQLLGMVDANKLVLRPAVELSYLSSDEQAQLISVMEKQRVVPSLAQAQSLKKYSQDGELTAAVMDAVLGGRKQKPSQVTLKNDVLQKYFPQDYTHEQIEDVIFSLLEKWKSEQEGGGTVDQNV